MQKESQTSFLSIQYITLRAKSGLLHYLLAWHSNLSLFLPFLMEFTLQLYYPAHQISTSFLLSPFPFPNFLSFFSSLGTMHVGRILLSLFQLHLVVLFCFLDFFPAKFICLVIQLLSVSHVLLLCLVPDHLFICHQVHHVLLAEHLQLLDSFSSENAGCCHHWYNWTELWLWTVIRYFFSVTESIRERGNAALQFSEKTEGFLARPSQA